MLHIFLTDITPLLERAVMERAGRLIPAVRRGSIRMIPEVQARVIGADLLLAYALKLEGTDLRSLHMENGPQGKPYFTDAPQLHFNISHSGDLAMCILADREAGCDVEHIRKESVLNVADHFFHPAEKLLLEKVSDTAAKLELFTRLWTLKESYIKVTGLGLSQSLRVFAVLPQPDGSAKLICDLPEKDEASGVSADAADASEEAVPACSYVFHHCAPVPGYMCSYALEDTETGPSSGTSVTAADAEDSGQLYAGGPQPAGCSGLPDPQLIDIMTVIDSLEGGNI